LAVATTAVEGGSGNDTKATVMSHDSKVRGSEVDDDENLGGSRRRG